MTKEPRKIRVAREPGPPELPLRRYWREREERIADQRRWATEIVDLDDD
jgi:hypothetical protein